MISWLSSGVIHALGWALIHSLWQGVGLAALAAVAMAFSRRPSIRYIMATVALVAMLAAPVLTFVILLKPASPSLTSVNPAVTLFALPASGGPALSVPARAERPSLAIRRASAGPILAAAPKNFLGSHFVLPATLAPAVLPWLVGAWLCGVACFSLRFAGGFLLLEHKRRGPSREPDRHILAIAHALQRQLGIARVIRYLECGWLQAPAAIGWLRPVILLPIAALTGLSEAQLRAVIAHELAHVKRLDALVNLAQLLAETLMFYHPAIWWLNGRIRAERELACDEIAVGLTGDRLEYAKAVALMAEWDKAPVLAMAANRGPLARRVVHILGKKPFGTGQRLLGLVGSLLFLAAAMGAANALLAMVPVSPAEASLKASSHQVAVENVGSPILPSAASARDVPPNRDSDSGSASPEQTLAVDGRGAAANRRAVRLVASWRIGKLLAPRPDLSRLFATDTPITPQPLASNDGPAPPAKPPADVSLALAARPETPAMTCAAPSIVDSADLKSVPGSDLRTVPVEINGRPEQFLLDIGTGPTQVFKAAAAELGLPDAADAVDPVPVALFNVKGSGQPWRPHVRVRSFAIGGATGHDLTLTVAQGRQMGRAKPYDGLITGDLFRQYDAELDFALGKLTYLTPTACADPNQVAYWPHDAAAAIPMTSLGGEIQVEVTIGGRAIPAVLDTSSPVTVMRRDIAELMFGLKADTPAMMPDGDLRDGTGQQVYRHTFTAISFSGVTALNVPALIQTASMRRNPDRTPILGSRAQFAADPSQRIPALTLGMDVLSQLHLYIVHGQEMLYVTPAAPPAALL